MNHVKLVKPQMELREPYLDFYHEWKESGEDMVPRVIGIDPDDFSGMLKILSDREQGIGLPDGHVPDSTFWLLHDHGRVLGAVNIRHDLTEFLFHAGGHIGYGIRPSERRKGYAAKLLELSLVEAEKLGIHHVLVVCDYNNIGSEQTILKHGGNQVADYIEDDGNVIKRFWIHNKKTMF
ncbi:GNAT family N-acetyltransferase [Paenibacillus lemnae]|uniref:GNAT family N-acetyltransferase n=1 Tax=Paenibacillus lemnae TaxID=1330551 RepID=A0A848M8J3_PAELE|nr:GNAT family N-acetyltransferase [Paenibacillus lemnae]NMO96589.1 GNAT family N-acetyltransferase [Paenibacillus lemnae]